MNSVTIKDFHLFNEWEVNTEGEKWNDAGEPKYLVDQSTGRSYWNESKAIVRTKSALLALGTPIVHTIASILNIVWRALKLLSFYHFWKPDGGDLKDRAKEAGIDLLRIFTQPFSVIGLELSALYGIFSPYNGRKLYASFERAQYNHFILAPCFQPDPTQHLFGGDPNKKDGF